MKLVEVEDASVYRRRFGIPDRLGSCHTAVVGGYVVEGHVHANEIKRLLNEQPKALGLTVPGMPVGSPGMEQGGKKNPYATLLVDERGGTSVYKRH